MRFFTESWMVLALVILLSMFLTRFTLAKGVAFAKRYHLMDHPCTRKRHALPTPMHGGIALFLGLFVAGFAFTTPALLLSGMILLIMGMLDDAQPRPAWFRLLIQSIAAMVMVVSGVKLTSFGHLFGDYLIVLDTFSFAVSIVAIVGCINAFNMLDGCDGLAALMGLTSIVALSVISGVYLIDYCLMVPLLLCFLLDNFRWMKKQPARVFLGDSGSMLLGLWVACCAIQLSQIPWSDMGQDAAMQSWLAPVNVLWCLALPLFDIGQVMFRRLMAGRSPLSPDRDHLHCVLIDRGVNPYLAVLFLIVVQIALCCVSGWMLASGVKESTLFYGFLLSFFLYHFALGALISRKQLYQNS